MIDVTGNAVKHLCDLLREQEAEAGSGLRIFVEKGGCAGLQYGMKIAQPQPGDEIARTEVPGAQVFVDPESAGYLAGCTVDYCDDLAGTGFRIVNPNAVRSCGCGTSFEAPAPAA